MPIFKLCAQNSASVEWSYFAQKWIKFHPQPSGFQTIFPWEKSQTLAYRNGEGMGRDKRFHTSKGRAEGNDGRGDRDGNGKGGGASGKGGSCSKVLRGIDAPGYRAPTAIPPLPKNSTPAQPFVLWARPRLAPAPNVAFVPTPLNGALMNMTGT